VPPFEREHDELRQVVRALLHKDASNEANRAAIGSHRGYDPNLWQRMCGELELTGLAVDTRFGGAGYGLVELAVVAEELGRAVTSTPFLASALTALALSRAQCEEFVDLTSRLVRGELIGTLIFLPAGRCFSHDRPQVFPRVPHGDSADVLLCFHRESVWMIDLNSAGVTRTGLASLDLTRRYARLEIEPKTSVPVAVRDPAAFTRQVAAIVDLILAAEHVGGAGRCLEIAVEHACNRVQFGVAIGTFQAVKHMCSEMLVELELARCSEHHALELASSRSASHELLQAVDVAVTATASAYRMISAQTIQVLGGIGFTWEHEAHLHHRRALAAPHLMATGSQRIDRLATCAGLPNGDW
jgi:alkylation response protein AidB-like acyl-CoA dehydrogenase